MDDIRYKLFNAMKNDLCVMAEHNDSESSLYNELLTADNDIIDIYKEIYLWFFTACIVLFVGASPARRFLSLLWDCVRSTS